MCWWYPRRVLLRFAGITVRCLLPAGAVVLYGSCRILTGLPQNDRVWQVQLTTHGVPWSSSSDPASGKSIHDYHHTFSQWTNCMKWKLRKSKKKFKKKLFHLKFVILFNTKIIRWSKLFMYFICSVFYVEPMMGKWLTSPLYQMYEWKINNKVLESIF